MHLNESIPSWIAVLSGVGMAAQGGLVLSGRAPRRYGVGRDRLRTGLGMLMVAAAMLIDGGSRLAGLSDTVYVACTGVALVLVAVGGFAILRQALRPTEPPASNRSSTDD
jgi:hypothetical protein